MSKKPEHRPRASFVVPLCIGGLLLVAAAEARPAAKRTVSSWVEKLSVTYTGGLADEFALPVDPTNRTHLETSSPPLGWKEFDDSRTDYWVGHTFESLPPDVPAGELVIRMRPEPSFSDNDTINLGVRPDGGFYYVSRIDELPEANGTWDVNQNDATTFRIDLTTELLDKIFTDERLEMVIQDDTNVDFVELHLLDCSTDSRFGGLADEFVLPVDPTNRTHLETSAPPLGWKEFDDNRTDYWVGHTFENLPPDVPAGELVIRMRPEPSLSDNDTINLGVRPDGGFYYVSRIYELPEANGSWNVNQNDATTFRVGLTTALLDKIVTDKRLEIVVQDDTNVDFVDLHLLDCSAIFADGFESGDHSAWSAVHP